MCRADERSRTITCDLVRSRAGTFCAQPDRDFRSAPGVQYKRAMQKWHEAGRQMYKLAPQAGVAVPARANMLNMEHAKHGRNHCELTGDVFIAALPICAQAPLLALLPQQFVSCHLEDRCNTPRFGRALNSQL